MQPLAVNLAAAASKKAADIKIIDISASSALLIICPGVLTKIHTVLLPILLRDFGENTRIFQ